MYSTFNCNKADMNNSNMKIQDIQVKQNKTLSFNIKKAVARHNSSNSMRTLNKKQKHTFTYHTQQH